MKYVYRPSIFILGLYLILFSACNKLKKQASADNLTQSDTINSALLNYCFLTKPVYQDYKNTGDHRLEDRLWNFVVTESFINSIPLKKNLKIDSSLSIYTSFEHQQEIIFNSECLDLLENPEKSFIYQILINAQSGPASKYARINELIQFVKKYKQNIFNYGESLIYEYKIRNYPESSYLTLILRKGKSGDNMYYGFAVLSDGLTWKYHPESKSNTLLSIMQVGNAKGIAIPLFFDGLRFVPVGHTDMGNWVNGQSIPFKINYPIKQGKIKSKRLN